jgi:hypothetical protein
VPCIRGFRVSSTGNSRRKELLYEPNRMAGV